MIRNGLHQPALPHTLIRARVSEIPFNYVKKALKHLESENTVSSRKGTKPPEISFSLKMIFDHRVRISHVGEGHSHPAGDVLWVFVEPGNVVP